MAKATMRDRPVYVAFTSDSDVGDIIAPPTPWSARAAIRASPLPVRAATMLATPKTTAPRMKTRRRPTRSPRRPAMMSSAAKTSE